MSLLFAALFFAGSARAADGRIPIDELYRRFETLSRDPHWTKETVFSYPKEEGQILAWRTKKKGPAVWLLAGIHGEEPAGPNAISRELDKITALAAAGRPIVLFPLCNPQGYRRNWRYPNTADRDWHHGGYSVGDSEYLLPDAKGAGPRAAKPVGPETEALTKLALRLTKDYPPALVIDLHEDELSKDGGYVYSQGKISKNNPVVARVVALLRSAGIPIRAAGRTRFDEEVKDGVIDHGDDGLPVKDGSIDEMLAAPTLLIDGKTVPGPYAPTGLVVETPAFSGAKLESRVKAQSAVIADIDELWRIAVQSFSAEPKSRPPQAP